MCLEEEEQSYGLYKTRIIRRTSDKVTVLTHLQVILILFLHILVAKGDPHFLLASSKDIRLVDASLSRGNITIKPIIKDLEDAAAVDFLFSSNVVFWTDVGQEMIKYSYLNGTKNHPKINVITTGLIYPDGLACDWLGHKLYWTDSDTNRIEVSTLHGQQRKVLFWEDLDQPRAIALVPQEGLMFWSDWGEVPKLERAGMNGDPNTRKVLVGNDIYWPNGLVADYGKRRLYWADTKLNFIASIGFDGDNRKEIIKDVKQPFALTMLGNTLFWTDWRSRSIHTYDVVTQTRSQLSESMPHTPTDIRAYSPSRQPPSTSPHPCRPGSKNGGCSHLCLSAPSPPFYSCACPTGIRLLPDRRTCASGPQDMLVLAQRTDLHMISLDTPDYTDVVLPVEGVKHAIAIDFDPVEGKIYWTDDEVRAIQRVSLDGSGQEKVVSAEVDHPDGIAVDWVARNFYWTDTGTDRIEVARLNGTSRKALIADGLDEPRSLSLSPSLGLMFWTDWGKAPKIERAAMDGTMRIVLINTSLEWPNGIAVDTEGMKLYWCDAAKDKIEVANLDGSDRREVLSEHLPHMFGFSLLGDFLYWTDWQRRSIERVHKLTGDQRMILVDQLPDLMGLKAVRLAVPIVTNACSVNYGGCSHLCLVRPGGYTCACPIGLELTEDNKTCVIPEAFLLVARKEDIRRLSVQSNHQQAVALPIHTSKDIGSLDFDVSDNRIYWSDIGSRSIWRAFLNGSDVERIVEFGLDSPEDVMVDWVSRNLYWVDSGTNRIEVSRLDGSSRKVLIWSDISGPRSIALLPSAGFLFFSQWGQPPTIQRAALTGEHQETFYSRVERPNSLTIDMQDRRLYWVDTDGVYSVDLNGRGVQHLDGLEQSSHPSSITLYHDAIFWSDERKGTVEVVNKKTGTNHSVLQTNLNQVVSLEAFHPSRQKGWNPCAVENVKCANLCLAYPPMIGNTTLYTCSCPTHYKLNSNNVTCDEPLDYLLYGVKNSIGRLVPDGRDCPWVPLPVHQVKGVRALTFDPVTKSVYWIDSRSKSIRTSFTNDSHHSSVVVNDLEVVYSIAIHPWSGLLYWSTTNRINVTRIQDGADVGAIVGGPDTRPRSLTVHPNKGLVFFINEISPPVIERCNLDGSSRSVIIKQDLINPVAVSVDWEEDLLFWTDQDAKVIGTANINGTGRKMLVDSELSHPIDLAIHGRYVYWIDAELMRVERVSKWTGEERTILMQRVPFLTAITSTKGLMNIDSLETSTTTGCRSGNNGGCSSLCLSFADRKISSFKCGCPMGMTLRADGRTCWDGCTPTQFACSTGIPKCIDARWRCDGQRECSDGSDEKDCPTLCNHGQFQCNNGQCIDMTLACDVIPHCGDGSDVHSCCSQGLVACATSPMMCTTKEQLCDGNKDCLDGSDEENSICADARLIAPQSKKNKFIMGALITAGFLIFFAILYIFWRKRIQGMEDLEDPAHHPLTPKNHKTNTSSILHHRLPRQNVYTDASAVCMSLLSSSSGNAGHHSTTSGSSLGAAYPLNPPPSPVTDAPSCCSSSVKRRTRFYTPTYPPPPTPCSTDVCDESDYMGDSDPFPPPPTPRSHYLSDDAHSYPPSPSTGRSSNFRRLPPPPAPSPVNHI